MGGGEKMGDSEKKKKKKKKTSLKWTVGVREAGVIIQATQIKTLMQTHKGFS